MGRSRNYGRALNGVLIVNKPAGASSNGVLQRAKRLFVANKAGHTGALDPLATGVLPICFGESTKFSQYLLDSNKGYRATFTLGVTTDSADSDGNELVRTDASHITEEQVLAGMAKYLGDILQIPPMYSALKLNGQPLYKLARAGVEVERAPRPVTIFGYELLSFVPGEVAVVEVQVLCSKGTYIRSLAADLGDDLGIGGHVSRLHRTQTADFYDEQAVDLDELERECAESSVEALDKYLLPVDAPIHDLAKLVLDMHTSHYFCMGQTVMDVAVYRVAEEGDTVRVFDENEKFLGVGKVTDDGRVAPKRLVAS